MINFNAAINSINPINSIITKTNEWVDQGKKYCPRIYKIASEALNRSMNPNLAGIGLVLSLISQNSLIKSLTTIFGSIFVICTIQGVISTVCKEKLIALTEDQSKNEVVLYCAQANDFVIDKIFFNKLKIFQELSKKHSLVLSEISSVKDINQAIDKLSNEGKKISILWIDAHGSPDFIRLGPLPLSALTSRVNAQRYQVTSIDEINFSKLEKPQVILECCSTSENISNDLNVAEWFQFYAGPSATVYGATEKIPMNGISHEKIDDAIHFKFRDDFFRDITKRHSYEEVVRKKQELEAKLNRSLS